jgi:acyl-CoA reductase-like NAD-dependent aldehyde dehydrogenase
MTELLSNYVSGQWQSGKGAGTALHDPVLGTALVRVDASGLDLAAAFAFARHHGGAALRALTYAQRAAMLAAAAKVLQANRDAYYDISTANSGTVKNDTAVRAALAAYYSGNKEGVQQAADKAANEPAPDSAITLALAQTAAVQ